MNFEGTTKNTRTFHQENMILHTHNFAFNPVLTLIVS